MVSIKDIAKAVGVSPSTISLVLNGKAKQSRISDELAEKIVAAAASMGYRPNRVAVGLRTGKSNTIGLIVENISNHFFSKLAKTVEDEARKYGYNVVYCSTENDPVKGGDMVQMLYHQQVDGYLITPVSGMESDIQLLLKQNKPVVFIDRFFDDIKVPYVIVDNYSGMKEGMEYLIEAGHRQIGYVTVDIDLVQINERKRAYLESLAEHALPVTNENVLTISYTKTREQSIAAITQFIEQRRNLEALVFATNYLGIYGLQSIKGLHLSIPDDIAILCFDDHDIFDLHTPRITVIEQPINDIARAAIGILTGELGHTKKMVQEHVILHTRLVKRDSI